MALAVTEDDSIEDGAPLPIEGLLEVVEVHDIFALEAVRRVRRPEDDHDAMLAAELDECERQVPAVAIHDDHTRLLRRRVCGHAREQAAPHVDDAHVLFRILVDVASLLVGRELHLAQLAGFVPERRARRRAPAAVLADRVRPRSQPGRGLENGQALQSVAVTSAAADDCGVPPPFVRDGLPRVPVGFRAEPEVPAVGGDTMFADMARAYDALSEPMQQMLAPLRAHHDFSVAAASQYSAQIVVTDDLESGNQPFHPVVRTHAETVCKSLFINPGFVSHFDGFERAESGPLLDFLYTLATRPEFIYRHRWQERDLVMWDNRSLMHYAVADYSEEPRYMERTTVIGDTPA